jgi:AcrR family transcriptional regulator
MARWEPDARGRLLRAAIDLFAEQGYDATTAAQIAARAGLTKTTLFRLFADKREILFQGQPVLISVVSDGVRKAADESPLELVRRALAALCATAVPEQQEIGRRIAALTLANPELQERAAFKRSALTAALAAALEERIGDGRLAGALADLGVRAYYTGFAVWTDGRRREPLKDLVDAELDALTTATAAGLR